MPSPRGRWEQCYKLPSGLILAWVRSAMTQSTWKVGAPAAPTRSFTTTILCSAAGSPSERFPSEGPSTRRTKTRLKCPINRRMRRQRALRPRPHLVGGVDFYIYRACDRRCLERPDGRPRLKFGDKKKVLAALDTESGRCWLRMESMHKLQKIWLTRLGCLRKFVNGWYTCLIPY